MTDAGILTKRSLRTIGLVWTLIACPLVVWGAFLLGLPDQMSGASMVLWIFVLPAALAVGGNAVRGSSAPRLFCHSVAAAAVSAGSLAAFLFIMIAIYGPPFT